MAIYPIFPGGRKKAFTLSYDDAWPEDRRLIEMMNKYGIKATFNINSGEKLFTDISDPVELYKGHEIAVHGLSHAYFDRVAPQTATYEIMKDRENLERIFGGSVRGLAYPYTAFNDETPAILKSCGIAYARTATCSGSFTMPSDWYKWHPTLEHQSRELMTYCERFLTTDMSFNQCSLFFIYGHGFQLNKFDNWERMEELFKEIGGRDNVWYATNIEICDYITAFKNLVMSVDSNYIYNPTNTAISLIYTGNDFMGEGKIFEIKPGEHIYLNRN